jgi:glucose-1-phosphate thymidylyltransferase
MLPLTKVTNKHLLPVYNKPMIYYPIEALSGAGINEILLVTGGNSAGDFMRLLGNGADFDLTSLYFAYQVGAGGIADALRLSQDFCAGEKFCVILGDNIVERNLKPYVEHFRKQENGAMVLFNKVPDNARFGVPWFEGDELKGIEEKPKVPKSEYAVIGVYFYDSSVFDIISSLKPSARGEYEITDVNNAYLERGLLQWSELEGWWTDAGSHESLLRASNLVAKTGTNIS